MKPVIPSRSQRGVAVVTALLLTTLAITLIASLFWQQQVQVRSIENQRLQLQKLWILRGGLDLARMILREDARNSRIDYIGEPWSVPLEEIRLDKFVENGREDTEASDATLAGSIEDAQSRFNLTNLCGTGGIVKDQVTAFETLLSALGLDKSLAQATANVMLSAQTVGGKSDPPQTLRITRADDLLAVPGMTREIFERLKKFVIVLPRATRVNVNTASPEVISAVVPGLSLADASAVTAARAHDQYYNNVGDFSQHFPGRTIATDNLDVQTSYFLVNSKVRLNRAFLYTQSLIERNGLATNVLWIHEN